MLTIKTDRCPLKRQNYDYAMYLLTVLYHESWKTEEWEKKKTEADMEEYVWKDSASEKNILKTLFQIKAAEKNTELSKEELLSTKEVEDYKNSVVSLKNEGDNENTLSQYKESVKRLFQNTERTPQTQQFKQDEETEEYPAGFQKFVSIMAEEVCA